MLTIDFGTKNLGALFSCLDPLGGDVVETDHAVGTVQVKGGHYLFLSIEPGLRPRDAPDLLTGSAAYLPSIDLIDLPRQLLENMQPSAAANTRGLRAIAFETIEHYLDNYTALENIVLNIRNVDQSSVAKIVQSLQTLKKLRRAWFISEEETAEQLFELLAGLETAVLTVSGGDGLAALNWPALSRVRHLEIWLKDPGNVSNESLMLALSRLEKAFAGEHFSWGYSGQGPTVDTFGPGRTA